MKDPTQARATYKHACTALNQAIKRRETVRRRRTELDQRERELTAEIERLTAAVVAHAQRRREMEAGQ